MFKGLHPVVYKGTRGKQPFKEIMIFLSKGLTFYCAYHNTLSKVLLNEWIYTEDRYNRYDDYGIFYGLAHEGGGTGAYIHSINHGGCIVVDKYLTKDELPCPDITSSIS